MVVVRLSILLVSNQHLLLISCLSDMALWTDSYVVVPTKVFTHQAHLRHLAYYLPNVQVAGRHGLDDVVVVSLKEFNILVGETILDAIMIAFDVKLNYFFRVDLFFEVEDRRHLLLLTIVFDDPSSFLRA